MVYEVFLSGMPICAWSFTLYPQHYLVEEYTTNNFSLFHHPKSHLSISFSTINMETQEENLTLLQSVQSTTVLSSCEPRMYQVVFFIRIPKCASTSFVDIVRELAKSATFEFFFHPSGAFNWNEEQMKEVADFVLAKSSDRRGFMYAQHLYHINFHQFGLVNYTYVTIMREPVSRYISSYLYYHFSSKANIQRILDPAHRNETLEECLLNQHEGCTSNLMTKYFCGHELFCKLGNREALQKAKSNLQAEFAVVGIMEEMILTVQVLKVLLPTYFGLLTNENLPFINKNERKLSISEHLQDAIRKANAADIELYNFARDLLHQKAITCGLTLQ